MRMLVAFRDCHRKASMLSLTHESHNSENHIAQKNTATMKKRNAPVDMSSAEFRAAGHQLIDTIADLLESLPNRPVTTGEAPSEIRELIGSDLSLRRAGTNPTELLSHTATKLFDHSLFNGHPKFLGYITSSAAPIGILAEALAATVNPNVGGWTLSPVATEIELQTIRWISELIGYDGMNNSDCGGVLVSGGNMANFVGFLVGRRAKAGWDIQKYGMRHADARQLRVYVSAETHTWVYKAADMCGLGSDSIRWIKVDKDLRMDLKALKKQINADLKAGDRPFMVVGTAGSVSTGVVDPLAEIAKICKKYDLWFHADGAYGAFAAALPESPEGICDIIQADSIAMDPHKWLYSPIEAGCALVRDAKLMSETFSYHPPYYKFDDIDGEPLTSLVDFSPQNTRGFKALKVWLALQQAGGDGYREMISDDIALAERLFEKIEERPELEALTQHLSITTFRYAPEDLASDARERDKYLDELNSELLSRLQRSGELFISNAIVHGMYALRSCIVNFRTTESDIDSIPEIVIRFGREVDAELRPTELK
jgi:aromatic-L-amino-acid/L-tryptophan decarboxylase